MFATGDANGEIYLWDMISRQQSGQIEGRRGAVHALAFSPDGTHLAIGKRTGAVRLWDIETKTLQPLGGHGEGAVHTVAFHPDGKVLASGGGDKTVRLWSTGLGDSVGKLTYGHLYGSKFAFVPSIGSLASAGHGDVFLWDLATQQPSVFLEDIYFDYDATAFSPDGRLFAVGESYPRDVSKKSRIFLWSLETGQRIAGWQAHDQSIMSLSFSADSKYLASSDGILQIVTAPARPFQDPFEQPNTIRVWEVDAQREIAAIQLDKFDYMVSVLLSPNGRYLASAGEETGVRLWEVETRQQLAQWDIPFYLQHMAFSSDGRIFAVSGETETQLWSLDNRQMLGRLDGSGSLVFSPDGKWLVSGGSRLWDVASQTQFAEFTGGGNVAFSPDGQVIATGGGREIRFWDVNTREPIGLVEGQNPFGFSLDGEWFVAGGGSGIIRLWDTEARRPSLDTNGPREPASPLTHGYGLEFSPDSQYLIVK